MKEGEILFYKWSFKQYFKRFKKIKYEILEIPFKLLATFLSIVWYDTFRQLLLEQLKIFILNAHSCIIWYTTHYVEHISL